MSQPPATSEQPDVTKLQEQVVKMAMEIERFQEQKDAQRAEMMEEFERREEERFKVHKANLAKARHEKKEKNRECEELRCEIEGLKKDNSYLRNISKEKDFELIYQNGKFEVIEKVKKIEEIEDSETLRLEKENAKLNRIVEQNQEELANLRRENAEFEERAEEGYEAHIKDLARVRQEEKENKSVRMKKLHRECEELRCEIEGLEKENSYLRSVLNEKDFGLELANLKRKNAELAEREKEKNIVKMNKLHRECEKLRCKNEGLEKEISCLRSVLNEKDFGLELANLKRKEKERNEVHKKELATLSQKRDEFRDKFIEVKVENAWLKHIGKANVKLKRTVEQHQKELANLKKNIALREQEAKDSDDDYFSCSEDFEDTPAPKTPKAPVVPEVSSSLVLELIKTKDQLETAQQILASNNAWIKTFLDNHKCQNAQTTMSNEGGSWACLSEDQKEAEWIQERKQYKMAIDNLEVRLRDAQMLKDLISCSEDFEDTPAPKTSKAPVVPEVSSSLVLELITTKDQLEAAQQILASKNAWIKTFLDNHQCQNAQTTMSDEGGSWTCLSEDQKEAAWIQEREQYKMTIDNLEVRLRDAQMWKDLI